MKLVKKKIEDEKQKLERRKYTEELFKKVILFFNENPDSDFLCFNAFDSIEMRSYISKLFSNKLIDEKYLQTLCDKVNLEFLKVKEIEGDYPTLNFRKNNQVNKKLERKK